ncbi:SDR family oxidoreductase [Pseudomonas sp. TMP25]|uniref:UDP-glucose 4-epimerase family protein n=1 Tax=Pseudomonas sp. TMP25 TaxID=3136561 RepID=UPI003100A986
MIEKCKILVTGASGFLGGKLMSALALRADTLALGAVRRPGQYAKVVNPLLVGELNVRTNWSDALSAVHVVIHMAARAHAMKREVVDALAEYRSVNVAGTLNLARQAATAGVRRFIFISSIGVNGAINFRPFRPDDQPNPAEPYAQSKWEAEQGLWEIQRETGMEVVIIRPPLVYGLGAPGNFGSLVGWVDSGIPLPLGAVHNKRSFVGVDNLVDLLIHCIDHPAAANQVFLAGDGEDLSTTELLHCVGEAMGKHTRLIAVPVWLLRLGASLLGKNTMAQRLLGSLQVDITKTCELLEWKPPYTVREGLKLCFEHSN